MPAALVAVTVPGVLLLLCFGAGRLGLGPLAVAPGPIVTQHEPQKVLLDHSSPKLLKIGVAWSEDGYCSGQFTLSVTETPTEVRVGTVTSRDYPHGTCAGLGSWQGMAWPSVVLADPLGNRAVVRDSDGARLPLYDSPLQLASPLPTNSR